MTTEELKQLTNEVRRIKRRTRKQRKEEEIQLIIKI